MPDPKVLTDKLMNELRGAVKLPPEMRRLLDPKYISPEERKRQAGAICLARLNMELAKLEGG